MFCEFGSVVLVNFFNLSDWFIKFNRMIKKKDRVIRYNVFSLF